MKVLAGGMLAAALLTGCGAGTTGASSPPPPTSPAPSVASAAEPARVATPADSQEVAEPPVDVRLPSGRVLPVDAVGTRRDGVLDVPDDVRRAGWWKGSSRLGDPFGPVVVAAHVDSWTQGVGPAAELLSTRRGDRIRLGGADRSQWYVVTSVRQVPRADLRRSSVVFSAAGDRRLVLVTCGGPYLPDRGYRDNVVVVARPAAR